MNAEVRMIPSYVEQLDDLAAENGKLRAEVEDLKLEISKLESKIEDLQYEMMGEDV